MSSLRSFIWCYSFFYWFCHFRVTHSLNNYTLLVRVCVLILSLPMESYKSKDISIMTRALNKLTTSHESSRLARFHHINIFFLELVFGIQNPKAPWMVFTTTKKLFTSSNIQHLRDLKMPHTTVLPHPMAQE